MADDLEDFSIPDLLGDFEELVFKNVDIKADELTLEIPEEGMSGEAVKKVIASRILQALAPFLQ